MGYIKKEWIIVDFQPEFGKEKESIVDFKMWLEDLNREERSHFFLGDERINGYRHIFMDWDGSKEGWDTSKSHDLLRERFLSKIKEIAPRSNIYKIYDSDNQGSYLKTEDL